MLGAETASSSGSPHAPLVADLVRLARRLSDGDPFALVSRVLLGRSTDLSPPPGAHLVTIRASWDDLVLPPSAIAALRDFTSWIRFRSQVINDWQARRIGGPLALFSGPSGSGKSFAAGVIAAQLSELTGESWALYVLDLGRIMSKYVGETEQNLNALLDALEGRNAILQIDEADGCWASGRGDRCPDRCQFEVSHMLSRFERHAGPVILTTTCAQHRGAFPRFQQIFPPRTPGRKISEKLLAQGAPCRGLRGRGTGERCASRSHPQRRFFASVLARERRADLRGPPGCLSGTNKDRQVRRSGLPAGGLSRGGERGGSCMPVSCCRRG